MVRMYKDKNGNEIVENKSDSQRESPITRTTSNKDLVEVERAHYTISELALRLGIKSPTLRKYENDYELYIPRNELGHRFYSRDHLEVFQHILTMKAEGANIHVIKKSLSTLRSLPKASLPLSASKPLGSLDLLKGMEDRVTNMINEALGEGVSVMAKMLEASFLAIVERVVSDNETKKLAKIEQKLLAKVEVIVDSGQGERARFYEERLQEIEKAIKADIACGIAELMKQSENEHEQIMEYIVDAINTLQRFIVDALKNGVVS